MTDPKLTPPLALVQQWVDLLPQGSTKAFTAAAQWGADCELDACCEWLSDETLCESNTHRRLRAARRPKPPSLKEQALAALNEIEDKMLGPTTQEKLIRKALEELPE